MKFINPTEHLAGVFKGGRISAWVDRNRNAIQAKDTQEVELELLLTLSPGFAEKTKGSSPDVRLSLIQQALTLADASPLSATRL